LSLSPAEQLRSEGKVGFPMPISAGGGWFSTADWRKSFDTEITDLWNKVDLLRAVANNRGVKATDQDLVDALELGQTLLSEDAPDLTNLGSDIARNPAASDATKAAALAFREKAFERLSENLVAETPVAETPPQDQTIFRSVENVVAPVPEAGVETGMEKQSKAFKDELGLSGVAYLDGDRWGIKQSCDREDGRVGEHSCFTHLRKHFI
jgi:hypothetical protein